MKPARNRFGIRSGRPLAGWWLGLACLLLWCGCDTLPLAQFEPPTYYHPKNVKAFSQLLPPGLKRVALLPLTTADLPGVQQAGVEALEPVLQSELGKSQRFEVVTVSQEELRKLTGRTSWRADEPLPLDFFQTMQRETGCDAVMFCQLTHYQAYPPVAVGFKLGLWKLNLAAAAAGQAAQPLNLWSVDEVLDAGDTTVAKAAKTFYSQHVHGEQPVPDPGTILRSPSLFGQFTLNVLFGTLPEPSAN